jgi:hypothetical protein
MANDASMSARLRGWREVSAVHARSARHAGPALARVVLRAGAALAGTVMLFGSVLGGGSALGARAARVMSVRDKAELHRVRAVGETLIEEGRTSGTLPGTAKIRIDINAANGTATAQWSFYLQGGTLRGHSSGTSRGGHGGWESFSGKVWLERGSGRYAHASGTGTMYGAINRRTGRLIVQEFGLLHY